jgi:hypothetical protein
MDDFFWFQQERYLIAFQKEEGIRGGRHILARLNRSGRKVVK